MIRLNECSSLSEGKTISGRIPFEWTKSSEGIKILRRKQRCLECKNEIICCNCVEKRKMNCFICEMERSCNTCLGLRSRMKTYSVVINMLIKKPPNEYQQMLLWYVGFYTPRKIVINSETAKEHLLKQNGKMVVKGRFERMYVTMECKSYMINEDNAENKGIFVY